MAVDIKTNDVQPLRHTFAHLARRFGDKPASRYQEATYDIQSMANFQYKPLWDADHELYDPRRTAIRMGDWYALKDPRQFYYGAYTITRARWQEAIDRQLDFVEKRGLLRALPAATQDEIVFALVPLRHYEWGANTNNAHMTAYGYGAAVTQATMMNTMDRLGMAQHISRIGLLIDGNSGDSLSQAKRHWVDAPAWQGMRREMEHMFVTRDWFELMVAQNLVSDALVYPLMYQHFDARIAQAHGAGLSMMTEYLMRWYEESSKWVDALVKAAAADNADNKAQLGRWAHTWRDAHVAAVRPLAEQVLGGDAQPALNAVTDALDARLAKLGLN
jgi:phenol/toluene 2-monooxygenase (NADH) P1/A1